MSFILDALKKSDKKRQDGQVPKLETLHAVVPEQRSRTARWRWWLTLLLVLNAGILVWLFGPWQDRENHVAGAAPPALAIPTPVAKPSPVDIEEAAAEPAQSRAPLVPAAIRQEQDRPQQAPAAVARQTPAPQPQPEVEVVVSPPKPAPAKMKAQRIYAQEELPAAIRRSLPELHMSLHAYNSGSPEASLIRLNDQIMRKGDRLADRYVLETITADGAVFSYDGYRFLVPRKQFTD